jgi:ribonuclease T2
MNKKRNNLRRFSPAQLLLIGLLFAAAVLYQILGSETGQHGLSDAATVTPTIGTQPLIISPTTAVQGDVTKSAPNTKQAPSVTVETMSNFDYFVLALSWSPDYCATSGGDDPQQCSLGKQLGFVLHGLWPQNNKGYPANCSAEKMPQGVKIQFAGLFPNDALFDHEWEKHGTCTGLTPARFLALSQQIKNSVAIPAVYRAPATPFRTTTQQMRIEFTQANPDIPSAAIETNCSGSGRYFKELYICFSRAGSPITCGAEVHNEALRSCQAADFTVRNAR